MTLPARVGLRPGPVSLAFVGSLALSAAALLGSTLNRDGMLYVRTAQAYLDGGFEAARESFNWLFLPILMALVSRFTGLGPEAAGHAMNALFMAGACALLVACVARRQPELAPWACLAVLAVTGINEYRHELVREYGCWFFVMLAFWLALRWDERPGWAGALAVQGALALAALFRPESLALFPALVLWQVFAAPAGRRWRRTVMIGLFPALAGAALLWAYQQGALPAGSRLAEDFGRFSLAGFDVKAQALAAVLFEHARDEARTILLLGSLALVPLKLVQKLGLFVLPLVFLLAVRAAGPALARHPLFAWGVAAHVPVLAVFVVDLQFLAGRYVGLTLLFLVPFVAAGLQALVGRHPRWRLPVLALALAVMVANVVSGSNERPHVVQAGAWLAANVEQSPAIYLDSRRVAHHARWYEVPLAGRNQREAAAAAVAGGRHSLFVFEVSGKDEPIEPWLDEVGLRLMRRFDGEDGSAVIVAEPADAAARRESVDRAEGS